MVNFVALMFLLCLTTLVSGQSYRTPRTEALSGLSPAVQGLEALAANPAGIAVLNHFEASVNASSIGADWTGISWTVLAALPLGKLGAGFRMFQVSAGDWHQDRQMGMTISTKLFSRLAFSLGTDYHQLMLRNYGVMGAWKINTGVQMQISSAVLAGLHWSAAGDMQLGLRCSPYEKLLLYAGYGTDNRFSGRAARITGGLEYLLAKRLWVRGGMDVLNHGRHLGLSLIGKRLNVDLAVRADRWIGIVSDVGIRCKLHKSVS